METNRIREILERVRAGELTPDARVICAEEPEENDEVTAGLKTCTTTDATSATTDAHVVDLAPI